MVYREDEYQDPLLVGSLIGALRAWQCLLTGRDHAEPQHLAFRYSCPSESRARRVAAFLRRRVACDDTSVRRMKAQSREEWHVDGTTRQQQQSLPDLERLFTWLRRAADSHQVRLIDLSPQWECE